MPMQDLQFLSATFAAERDQRDGQSERCATVAASAFATVAASAVAAAAAAYAACCRG
jgi:hypothetical protein